MASRLWYCWALLVVKTTYPSADGSIEGTSMDRPVPRIGGQPMNSANTDGYGAMVTAMQSNMATSTCSPRPLRRVDRRAARAPMAA